MVALYGEEHVDVNIKSQN